MKCKFLAKTVVFLGHVIDEHDLRPVQKKVKALQEAPVPKNVSELKSYLELLTYFSKTNMADMLAPLYAILGKEVKWT